MNWGDAHQILRDAIEDVMARYFGMKLDGLHYAESEAKADEIIREIACRYDFDFDTDDETAKPVKKA